MNAAEVPKMTATNALAVFLAREAGKNDPLEMMQTYLLDEVHQVVSAFASGRLRTYSPEIGVVVPREDLEGLRQFAAKGEAWGSRGSWDFVLKALSLWLAVPAAEGGET